MGGLSAYFSVVSTAVRLQLRDFKCRRSLKTLRGIRVTHDSIISVLYICITRADQQLKPTIGHTNDRTYYFEGKEVPPMHGESYGEVHGAPVVTGNQLKAVGSQPTRRLAKLARPKRERSRPVCSLEKLDCHKIINLYPRLFFLWP